MLWPETTYYLGYRVVLVRLRRIVRDFMDIASLGCLTRISRIDEFAPDANTSKRMNGRYQETPVAPKRRIRVTTRASQSILIVAMR